jgi:hypothetical protein
MWRKTAIGALLVVAATSAMAEDQQCAAARKNTVPEALKTVAELDGQIEQVPPDEANYYGTEYVAATKANSKTRLAMLERRRYFQAWMLHDALSALRDDLAMIDGAAYGPAERVKTQRAAFALARLTIAVQDFTEYSVADERRARPMLSGGATEKDMGELVGLAPVLAKYINCTVDAIK